MGGASDLSIENQAIDIFLDKQPFLFTTSLRLKIRRCKISDRAAKKIASLLIENKALKYIELADNILSDEALICIIHSISASPNLLQIHFGQLAPCHIWARNKFDKITHENHMSSVFIALASLIQHSPSLVILNMYHYEENARILNLLISEMQMNSARNVLSNTINRLSENKSLCYVTPMLLNDDAQHKLIEKRNIYYENVLGELGVMCQHSGNELEKSMQIMSHLDKNRKLITAKAINVQTGSKLMTPGFKAILQKKSPETSLNKTQLNPRKSEVQSYSCLSWLCCKY